MGSVSSDAFDTSNVLIYIRSCCNSPVSSRTCVTRKKLVSRTRLNLISRQEGLRNRADTLFAYGAACFARGIGLTRDGGSRRSHGAAS